MKISPFAARTLAALLTGYASSEAAITIFQNDLSGFTSAAGLLPIFDFESIGTGTDIAGSSFAGITFSSPAGNSLPVVAASSTFSPGGFSPTPGDSDNRLFATSGLQVLSPGGTALMPGPNLLEVDGLRLIFDVPVSSFGIDVLFQSLDGAPNTTFEIRDTGDNVIASGTVNIPTLPGGPDLASSASQGGSVFIGFHSNLADIARIDFIESDGTANQPDSNIGYDTIRAVPEPGALGFSLTGLLMLSGRLRRGASGVRGVSTCSRVASETPGEIAGVTTTEDVESRLAAVE